MKPRDAGNSSPTPQDNEPTAAEAMLPRLPGAPPTELGPATQEVTGREFFALPDRARSDGGPVFDSIELAPVAQIDAEGTCEAFESLDEVPEELRGSVFWSIYGHTSGEGVQCIGDFTTATHALEVVTRLFGDLKPLA
ncbi:MAG TPA: hypothetical protein VFF58_00835 [Candidatus Nitrosotalea sp.]|nr:hypothetical protein [Candidatus Nitrosotalea sp.]